jgi:hypothetical protein
MPAQLLARTLLHTTPTTSPLEIPLGIVMFKVSPFPNVVPFVIVGIKPVVVPVAFT